MIVSLISGGAGYLEGAKALSVSLQDHEPNIPRLLLVEDGKYNDTQIQSAERSGWSIRIVSAIRPPKCKFKAKRWPMTFTKLHIWNVDTQRIVYLDADCFVLQPFFLQITCREINNLGACWVVNKSPRFNSGVMVIDPNKNLFDSMVHEVTYGDPSVTQVAGSDQSYLNMRFPNWTQIPDRFNYRTWSSRPGNLAIGHIRPHPWSNKTWPSQHYKSITEKWREALSRA